MSGTNLHAGRCGPWEARSSRSGAPGWPGTGQPVLGPGRVTEWPVWPDPDGLAFGVDLAGLFPVLADGLVRQPGVVGGHGRRVVVEELLDHVLGDIAVDKPGSQAVAPLVGSEMHGIAVLVADVAGL